MFNLKSKFRTVYSSGFKRYFTNTSWMMAEKITRMAVVLFIGILVARYLGPSKFGLLSYAISFVGLFSVLATLGLEGIVVRNLVQNIKEKERLLGTAFILKLVGGVMLFGVVSITVQLTSSDAYTKMLVLITAGGMIFESFKVIDFYFQSQVLGRLSSIAGFWSLFVSALTKLALILFRASLIWFAFAVVLETAILGLVLVFLYLKQRNRISWWRFEWSIAKELLLDSWPLILSGLAVMLYMRIDQVMIKEVLDSEAVGNYAIAVRLSEACYFIPIVVTSSLFPAILEIKKKSQTRYYDKMQNLYDLMIWMAILIAIPTTFLADWIVTILFGTVYAKAGIVLAIHIWTGIFVFIGVASGKWLLAENLQIFTFYRTAIGAIVNVILNLFFIPMFGIKGAAWATLFSQAIASYIGYAFSSKTFIVFKMQTLSIFWPLRKLYSYS